MITVANVPASQRSLSPIAEQCRAPNWDLRGVEDLSIPELGQRACRSGHSEKSRSGAQTKADFEALTDLDLLRCVAKGDHTAWGIFYDRFRSLMIACASRVCLRAGVRLQADDLMDVLGDTCLNMVAHDYRRLRLYRVDGGCSVSSWIGIIATSTAHDYLRRERRRRTDPMLDSELERVAPPVAGPDCDLIDRQQRAFVDEALRGFSKRDRRFVELYFVEAWSPDKIAEEMAVSVSTVYSKKAKIKTRLQKLAMKAA